MWCILPTQITHSNLQLFSHFQWTLWIAAIYRNMHCIPVFYDTCFVMCIASRSSCQYPAIPITCRFRVSFEIWRITHTWLIQWVICVQHEGPTGSPEGSLSLRIRVPDGRQCYTTLCQCARSLTPLSSAGKLLKTSFYCLKLNQSWLSVCRALSSTHSESPLSNEWLSVCMCVCVHRASLSATAHCMNVSVLLRF